MCAITMLLKFMIMFTVCGACRCRCTFRFYTSSPFDMCMHKNTNIVKPETASLRIVTQFSSVCVCVSRRPVHSPPLQAGAVYGIRTNKSDSAAPLINPPKLSAFEEARIKAQQPELKSKYGQEPQDVEFVLGSNRTRSSLTTVAA